MNTQQKVRTRKNVIEIVNEEIVRKISIVQEKDRPHRLKIEAWALSQARRGGINVPRVIDYYVDRNGREVLTLERIYGKPLRRKITKDTVDSLFDVGIQMNSVLLDASLNYGWIDSISMSGINKSWPSFLRFYTKKFGEQLVKSGIIEERILQKIFNAIDSINLEISAPFLVNGDIRFPHLIRDKSGKVWIVDWENVILGDPLWDLAFFGTRYGHGILWKAFGSGYRLSFLPPKYTLYEIIALVGTIAFFQKHRIKYQGKLKKLLQLVYNFQTL